MSKLNCKTHAVNFSIQPKLEAYLDTKISKLSIFFDKIVDVEVYLKLESEHESENKIAEIKIHVPKHDIFAKKNAKSFEEAIDSSTEAIRRQLKKIKEKMQG